MQLIDGKKIAEEIKDKIALEIFKQKGDRPNLAIIIVGEREDSKLYVSLKERESKKVGIDTHIYHFDNDVDENELLDVIDFLNNDQLIDAILVQLPLPDRINTDKIIQALDPNKDVDGFHPDRPEYIISPVLLAVRNSLAETGIDPFGKKACLLYNSDVFGNELREFVKTLGFVEFVEKEESNQADVIISAIAKPHSIKAETGIDPLGKKICLIYNSDVFGDELREFVKTLGFEEFVKREESDQADVIISAIAKPHSIKAENIKKDAILIDISTVKKDKKVLGDVDLESVKDKASFVTPVPGGIGPMTIAFLLENVLKIYKKRIE